MYKLTLRVGSGQPERSAESELIFTNPFSQRVVAGLLACTVDEIQNAAKQANVAAIYKELSGESRVFYDIESVRSILFQLNRTLGMEKPWLGKLKGTEDDNMVEVGMPNGSTVIITKE